MESPSPSGPLDPSAFSTRPRPASPKRIGRYELRFELASGGMASVFLARAEGAPGFQKLIALKRIHSHLATEKDYVEMFLDEARIASRITHANVCSVFDFGEADGEYYIAMEYLVGEPLSRVHRRVMANADQRSSALLPARMARVIAGACEGLHAAHELKDADGELLRVVHRDVSAENLFVTYDGLVQVVDFGIAHARERVHHTSAGQVKGTFPYMAPEQMTAAVVDRRVDVWALGAVLWELLTLRRLFLRDNDVNTMYAVLSGEIRPPSDYRKDVPPELDSIVLRALQRNPDERWPNARQMGTALRQFLAKQEELVGPAELADWMAELFPDGELRKHRLMEIARTTDEADSPEAPRSADERSGIRIPWTKKRATPTAPPLPASLLVLMIGIATVLGVLALDWLR
ncbi:MAG: serine/threonine protein kinase [Myxococcales bacterium]|nr:serine/threonine protein kinase [Myxococcales bacterium]MDH3483141.1 serine/threonine protein kinase [Myxococcales bacterium]